MVFNKDLINNYIQYGQVLKAIKPLNMYIIEDMVALGNAVQNLTPKQQALALATKGLTQTEIAQVLASNQIAEAEIQQVIADTALITQKKQLTKEYALEAITAQGLSATKAEEIMISAGIIAGDNAEVISKKQVSVATLEAKLAQEGLSATQIKAITTQLGLGTSTVTLSNYFKGLAASTWASVKAIGAFLVTNPIGWAILAGTAIAGVVAGIVSYNKHQEELRDKALESANTLKEQADAMDNLVSQYEAILDSEKTETEKVEELNKWKQTLADTYGITKDKLADLNLEREDGIKLLQEEIKYAKIKQQLDWQESNKNAISNSKNKIEHAPSFNQDGNVYGDGVDYWTGIDYSISDEIKNLFDEVVQVDEFTVDFKINTDNAIDEYERLQSILTEIDKISIQRDLTESEQLLYNDIKTQIAYLETLKDDMEIYKQNISSEAMIKFEGYKLADDSYKNLGKDSYLSWRDGLLATADGDKALEKELLALAEKQFPDYAKYFNNLETAKKMFIGGANPNSGYTARIKNYLESLSDEDLEIATKIPDLFANGLEGAAAKIKEWKANPDNTIEPTVNTKPVDELVKEVSDKTKLIKSAMEDLNDTGHISSSTYAEIVEMGGNFIECLELQNGQLTLNIEKLKDLETQEYKNAIAANNLAIAELQMNINSGYDYLRIKKKVDDLKEQNALYTTLIEEIYNTAPSESNSKSSSSVTLPEEYTKLKKALEHEYAMGRKTAKEYYTELNSLAVKWLKGNAEYADEYMSVQETVYSGLKSLYSEVVNEQIEGYENVLDVLKNINQEKIDSLNKEKELLEDNADEEQRILDLKKAQLDLENAKKRTTWVITEQGLKQVQDEKSVKEAQDALDKLELESKTTQIDKKIKALEDENDKYDKIKTDWQNKTNLEEAKKFIGSDNIKGAVSEGFKEGYINALNEKQSIDNSDKSTNKVSNPITIDDLLKKLGSKYTFDEIKDKAYNLAFSPYAFNSFADNVKTATENIVNNINNNSSKVGDINIIINDATDPEKVGNVVVEKLTDIATKWSNSSGRYLRSSY